MKKIFIILQLFSIILAGILKSQTTEALLKKGDSLLYKGQYSEAEKMYNSILSSSPQNIDALLSYGKLFFYSGRYKKAEEALQKVIKLAPKYEDIYEILGNVYLSQDKIDEANDILESVYSQNPKRSDILLKILTINRNFGKYIKAREIRDKIIKNGFKDSIPIHFLRNLLPFQIDAQYGYETVNPKPDWNDQSVSFMYIGDKFLKFLGSVERFQKFGLNNTMISISTYFPFPRNFNWYLNAGYTPNSTLLPESRFDIYLQGLVYKSTSAIGAVSLMNFPTRKVHYFQLGVDQYFGEYSAAYQFYFSEYLSSSHLFRINWYGEDNRLTLGFATGNEFYNIYSENLLDIKTYSIFGNFSHWLTTNLGIQANISYSHTNQPQDRTRIGIGITTKF